MVPPSPSPPRRRRAAAAPPRSTTLTPRPPPKCLAEVACINLCIGKPDLGACQIRCGDIFDDPSIDKFNACALTQKKCVPQRADDGSYPEPPVGSVVDKFDVGLMDGAWCV